MRRKVNKLNSEISAFKRLTEATVFINTSLE